MSKDFVLLTVTGNPGIGNIVSGGHVTGWLDMAAGDDGLLFDITIFDCDSNGNPSGRIEVQKNSIYTHSSNTFNRSSGNVVAGTGGPGSLVDFNNLTQRISVSVITSQKLADLADLILANTFVQHNGIGGLPDTIPNADSDNWVPGYNTSNNYGALVTFDQATTNPSSGNWASIYACLEVNPSGNFNGDVQYYATENLIGTKPSNTQPIQTMGAVYAYAYHNGSGEISALYGVESTVVNAGTGTIDFGYGFYLQASNAGNGIISWLAGNYIFTSNNGLGIITDGFGVYIDQPYNHSGATWTNCIGLYIADQSGIGSNVSENIHSAGTNSCNVFEGTLSIGRTTKPVVTAQVQIDSTTKGVLLPRMTTVQMNVITSPAEGLEIYNTDLHAKCYFNGSQWKQIATV